VFTYHNACSWAAHFNCIYHEKQKGKPSEKDLLFYYFSSDLSVSSFIRSLAPKAYTAIAKIPSNKPMQIAKIFMIIPFVLVSLFQLHISIKSKKANPPKKICPFEK
jgi:hypothetical protein